MARRRTMNRMALRDSADAAERLRDNEEVEEREDEEEADAEVEAEVDEDAGGGDEDEVEAPKPKKKPKAAKPPTTKKRAPKVVRMKVVWGVFNNSSQMVEKFPYNQKEAAEQYIREKMEADAKKMLYLQPVKEPLDE